MLAVKLLMFVLLCLAPMIPVYYVVPYISNALQFIIVSVTVGLLWARFIRWWWDDVI